MSDLLDGNLPFQFLILLRTPTCRLTERMMTVPTLPYIQPSNRIIFTIMLQEHI